MVPVGATNVGSIRINFDADLRTNKRLRHPVGTYMEAVYSKASSLLKGQPLRAGEEMGGFRLGSTIVLIFEAPKDFQFSVKEGEKIKVGEPIGQFSPRILLQTAPYARARADLWLAPSRVVGCRLRPS